MKGLERSLILSFVILGMAVSTGCLSRPVPVGVLPSSTVAISLPTSTRFPTAEYTLTLTLVPTATPRPTQTTTSTSTTIPTMTQIELEQPLSSRYMAITTTGKELFLVEIQTGHIRQLKTDEVTPVYALAFIKNGCEIIATDRDKRILQLNLKGEIIKEMLPAGWYQGDGWTYGIDIQPTGSWISYMVGTGKQGYASWEKQDLETMNLANKSVSRLTEHGGAWEAPWSPEGKWIAFTDLENDHRSQIYIAQQDGKGKRQLTNFMDEDQKFFMLVWSPDGKKIAFRSHNLNNQSTSFGIIYLDSNFPAVKKFPVIEANVLSIWWEDDETMVVRTDHFKGAEILDEGDAIVWLNINDGKIIDRLNSAQTPDKIFESAGYFGRWMVGFFSYGNFYTYNTKSKTINRYFNLFPNQLLGWSFSPLTFPGEENCN